MKILVCGDREYDDVARMRAELRQWADGDTVTVIHGAARGADKMAARIAFEFGWKVEAYPAKWRTFGRAAGPIRNRQMLDLQPDRVLAFHKHIADSRGTKDCLDEAQRRGIAWRLIDD